MPKSEIHRLYATGTPERRKNIDTAREVLLRVRAARTDEDAVLMLLAVIEQIQFKARRRVR